MPVFGAFVWPRLPLLVRIFNTNKDMRTRVENKQAKTVAKMGRPALGKRKERNFRKCSSIQPVEHQPPAAFALIRALSGSDAGCFKINICPSCA
jgi:hypothetical protein